MWDGHSCPSLLNLILPLVFAVILNQSPQASATDSRTSIPAFRNSLAIASCFIREASNSSIAGSGIGADVFP